MVKFKYNKERMKKDMQKITIEATKRLYAVVPLIVSAMADGIVRGFENRISKSIGGEEGTYASAISAIAKSDMSNYYQDKAIQAIDKNGTKEYYAAVEEIALSSNMNSYYRCESIMNISQ